MAVLRSRLLLALAALILLAPVAAKADPVPTGYSMWVNLGGEYFSGADLAPDLTFVADAYGGTWTLNGPVAATNGTVSSWSSVYDFDPFVTNNVSIVNTTGVVQTYIVGVTSPIAPQLPSTLMNGSIGITITNTPTGGVTLTSVAPDAVYSARIDGTTVATLDNHPYTLTCAPAFCSTTQNVSFGSPIPIGGPGATTNIGITLRFTLTPGDQASVTSVFNIVAVPEPGTALMLGAGLLGLVAIGRRRA